jgi:peptidoglycan hydrolase-like protein with peptidoglycan-binding domain
LIGHGAALSRTQKNDSKPNELKEKRHWLIREEMLMTRLVMLGHEGVQVTTLQRLLNSLLPPKQGRPPLKPDGIFGEKTDARVKEFQKLCKLDPDGIIGPLTNAKLLDIRPGTIKLNATPQQQVNAPAFPFKRALPFKLAAKNAASASPSVGQSADPPSKLKMSVEAQFGRALQLPPLDVSPWAIAGQIDIYVPNSNLTTEISVGGQVTKNMATSPNGKWTGQGFIQLGPTGIKFGQFGPIDLFNPSVILFAQTNNGKQLTGGAAISNQSSIKVLGNDKSKLGIFWFLNLQTQIFSVGLDDGKMQVPTSQVFTGFRGEFTLF